MFILELTHRSWAHSEENKRRTLQRNDIAAAITRTDIFDFLVCWPCDVVGSATVSLALPAKLSKDAILSGCSKLHPQAHCSAHPLHMTGHPCVARWTPLTMCHVVTQVDIVPREDRGADEAAAGRPAGMPGPQGGAATNQFVTKSGFAVGACGMLGR